MNPSLSSRLSQWGFDAIRLRFSLITAFAACLALIAGWALGLEHPQWSAMTVWAASQPLRGMMLEKSLFRLLGTLVGVLVGVALIWLTAGAPLPLVLLLTVWISLCVWAGNLLRGLIAYGCLLAGYSASMVTLLDTAHPDQIVQLGTDRFLTAFIGIIVALLVGLWFARPSSEQPIAGRVRRLTARILHRVAEKLRHPAPLPGDSLHALLSEMAAIDEVLDTHSAGSLHARRVASQLRAILIADLRLLMWLQSGALEAAGPQLVAQIELAAQAIGEQAEACEVKDAVSGISDLAIGMGLQEPISHLQQAIAQRLDMAVLHPADGHRSAMMAQDAVHRDWPGALQASLRTAITLLAVGMLWVLTGSPTGALVMLGTSVMISVFSTWENPSLIIKHVLFGQIAGASAALICLWLVWPLAGNGLQQVLLMTPFILIGALPAAHRRTMLGAYDFNMIFLLLMQPQWPLLVQFVPSLVKSLAVVAGPLIALIAYRYLFPTNARHRMHILYRLMRDEVIAMAQAKAGSLDWRSRLHHRVFWLMRWANRQRVQGLDVAGKVMDLLQIARIIDLIDRLEAHPNPAIRRAAYVARQRLAGLDRQPAKIPQALQLLANRLATSEPRSARELLAVAQLFAENSVALQSKAPRAPGLLQ